MPGSEACFNSSPPTNCSLFIVGLARTDSSRPGIAPFISTSFPGHEGLAGYGHGHGDDGLDVGVGVGVALGGAGLGLEPSGEASAGRAAPRLGETVGRAQAQAADQPAAAGTARPGRVALRCRTTSGPRPLSARPSRLDSWESRLVCREACAASWVWRSLVWASRLRNLWPTGSGR